MYITTLKADLPDEQRAWLHEIGSYECWKCGETFPIYQQDFLDWYVIHHGCPDLHKSKGTIDVAKVRFAQAEFSRRTT